MGKDTTVGTLSQQITNQLLGLKGLDDKLKDMHKYLEQVVAGKLPMNHQIVYHLQDIFNLVPDLMCETFVKSINVNTNDQVLIMYAASLIRSIIALHNLINNKITNKEAEKKETSTKKTAVKAAAAAGGKDEKDKEGDKKDADKKKEDKKDE